MGLFRKAKNSISSYSEKVNKAYSRFRPDMISALLPEKKDQASIIIKSLGKICCIDLDKSEADIYYDLLSVYLDVFIRIKMTQSSDRRILSFLQVKHARLIEDSTTAKQVLAFCSLNISDPRFSLDDASIDTTPYVLRISCLEYAEKITSLNKIAETENLDDFDYGKIPSKPVYTDGVNGSYKYLNSLKTENGDSLKWKRVESISVDGINGNIDLYESALPSGEPYDILFLNMYGSFNSTNVPLGYKMIDKKTN